MKKNSVPNSQKEKLLLIAPHFFNYYQEMIKEAEKLGYEVDCFCDAPSDRNVFKALARINPKLIGIKTKKYYDSTIYPVISEKKYDRILLIAGMSNSLSESMIREIREFNKDARFILYQWDKETNIPYVKRFHPYMDAIYSFELNDCYSNPQYCFIPNFYISSYEELKNKHPESFEYDCSYIGTAHPKKLKEIDWLREELKEKLPRQYIYHYLPSKLKYFYHKAVNEEYKNYQYRNFKKKPLSKEETLNIFKKSRIILDAAQGEQRGLTLRVFETLASGRKLITTNSDIVKYDFYDKQNILVADGPIDFTDSFFTDDFKEPDFSKYSLANWLKTVLNEEKKEYLKKTKKRILYLCSRNFFSQNTGHEVKMFHYLLGMKKHFDADIDLFVFDKSNKNEEKVKNIADHIVYAGKTGTKEKIKNLVMKTFLSDSQWPLQTSLYFSKENFKAIKNMSLEYHYDMVMVDMARLEPYIDAIEYPCVKVLDMDDLLSKRYKRQLSLMDAKTSIGGAYEEKLPVYLKKFLKIDFIKKTVLKTEIKRMEKAENAIYDGFDYLLFVSKEETDEVNNRFNKNKAIAIGLGADYFYFSKEVNAVKEKNTACFVGNMYYPPNADSLRFIVKEVLPNSRYIEQFKVIGNCPEGLQKEFENNRKVSFLGRVDDLRVSCKSSAVFLAPIAYGTGIKTKILEAMAMGLPIITNSIGAEGIPLTNGKEAFIIDDSKEMAKRLDELFLNETECIRLGKNAQAYAKENLDWDIILKNFEKISI